MTLDRPSAVVNQPRILRLGISTDRCIGKTFEETRFKLTVEGTFSLSLGSLAIHAGVATYTPLVTLKELLTLPFGYFYVAGGISLGGFFVSVNAYTNNLLDVSSYSDGNSSFGIAASSKWTYYYYEVERVEISYTVKILSIILRELLN